MDNENWLHRQIRLVKSETDKWPEWMLKEAKEWLNR